MGDAQSRSDAAEGEEERGEVADVEAGQNVEDKVFKNNGKISEVNKNAESSKVELNGHCEEEITTDAAICPEIKVSEPPKEEQAALGNEDIHLQVTEETEQVGHDDVIEMDANQNDINESFRKFFSNIGLKLTVKRGSTDKGAVPTDVSEEVPGKAEDVRVEETANEITENADKNTDLYTAEEAVENDSAVCQTLTDVTPADFQEEQKTRETVISEEEITSHDVETPSPLSEDATTQEEPRPASPAGHDETASPFKRFFTSGIFSGLRNKKKLEDDGVGEKHVVEGDEQATEATLDQQHDENVTQGVEEAKIEKELSEEKTKDENLISKSATAPSILVNEMNSQEMVQESPLKRLLSGSSFKKLGKKQKGRKSSDSKLSDSGDHISDQLLSSAESAENKKVETPVEVVNEEDGGWFSFKKLVTPQKKKKSSVDHEERVIPGSKDGGKSGEAEQLSDHSTEEGKRRKDSSVSWEAVLCGSGRRRSRKTSDSEDETPQDSEGKKQKRGSKEEPLPISNEIPEVLASAPKETGILPEEDESSTWRSFKKLVTPKKKVKEEEESTSDVGQDDSTFSIKRLLSGRKTRKSADMSAEEVGKEVTSISDEDSDTPAVVPLSEFDLPETQTETEKERYIAKDTDSELQMDIIEIKEEFQSPDTEASEAKEIPDDERAKEKQASSAVETDEEPDELTELSNHQQLSDIPEEGILTELTPASVAEDAAKDETTAEDLLEITSEAITAPEPADVTLADETEMVSAVSQLSESSKTSGDTTPIPAEYNIMSTESVLQQVSETISVSPNAVPVCLEETSTERVVCSVSHEILESSVSDQPKLLEIHRGSEAMCIKTGLHVEGIEAVNKVAATTQAESVSRLSEAIAIEIASEVPKEELDTADPAANDVCEANVSELKNMEITAESHQVVEFKGDVDDVVSSTILPKKQEVGATEEILTDESKNYESKTQSEEQLAVTSANVEEVGGNEMDQIVTEGKTEIKEGAIEHAQHDDKVSASVDELEELAGLETTEVASGMGEIQSDKERFLENIPSQGFIEASKENKELEIVQSETNKNEEVRQFVKAPAIEMIEGLVQTVNTEVSVSENISTAEMDIDKQKLAESLPEVTEKAEEIEPQHNQSEVTVELESDQTQTSMSEEDSAEFAKKEVSVSDYSTSERDAEELKQESLIEITKEVHRKEPQKTAPQIDGSEVAEVLESVQPSKTESEEDPDQSLHEEVTSPAEKHKEESKPLEPLAEGKNEQKDKESEINEAQTYQSEVTKGLESVQHAATLDSQKDTVVSHKEKESALEMLQSEPEQLTQASLTELTAEQEEEETKTDVAQTDNVEFKEKLKSVETPTMISEDDLVETVDKDTELDLQDQKEEQADDQEHQEVQKDASQIKEELIREQTPTITSEDDAVRTPDQPEFFSENISSTVTKTEKSEQVKSLSDLHEELDNKETQETIATSESSEAPQVSEVKEAIMDSEESRVNVLEKDITPFDNIPKAETAEEKQKEEPKCLTPVFIQEEDAIEAEHVKALEAVAAPSLDAEKSSSEGCDMEVIFDTSSVETRTEELNIADSNVTPSIELEDSSLSTQDISDLEICQPRTFLTLSDEKSKTQELQTMLQDIPQPEDTDIVPEVREGTAEQQLDKGPDTKSYDAKAEHKENVPEDVEGLQALTALHISSVKEHPRTANVLEKTCVEEINPVPLDLADISEESKNEINLCEQEEKTEREKVGLLSDFEIKVAATDHTVASHEVISKLHSVSTEKPNVLDQEAYMSKMASEIKCIDTVETAIPLVLEDINQIKPSVAVMTMRVLPVEIEVNHKVQVQLMDVDIRSAQNAIDTVIQVGITEDKEVIDVCNDNLQTIQSLSATAGIEGPTFEEIQVTVQDVMQHVTTDLPETLSNLNTKNVELVSVLDTVTEVSKMNEQEDVDPEDEKVKTVIERKDEEAAVITEKSGIQAKQEDLEKSKVPSIISQRSDVSIGDHGEDLEEVKPVELEAYTAVRDEELVGKCPNDSNREPLPSPQSQITTTGNSGLAVPQNTGLISSAGNLESPSSLSLEFKLNIQFAQAKAPTWPSSVTAERAEPVRQVDVSEAGVQVGKSEDSVHQGDYCKKQTELNEAAVQGTSITQPEWAVIASQPLLQDVGIQAMEKTEPVEEIQFTERAFSKVQAAKVSQSTRQEKRAVLLSKPLLSEMKKGWAFRQSEDETEQDVWLDAEEDIYPHQEPQPSTDKDENVKQQSESEPKDEAQSELIFKICGLEAEDTENRDALKKETCEMEDFTVALEDLGSSISAVK